MSVKFQGLPGNGRSARKRRVLMRSQTTALVVFCWSAVLGDRTTFWKKCDQKMREEFAAVRRGSDQSIQGLEARLTRKIDEASERTDGKIERIWRMMIGVFASMVVAMVWYFCSSLRLRLLGALLNIRDSFRGVMVPSYELSIALKRIEVPVAPNAEPPCLFHQDIRKTKVGGACESPKQAIANVRAGAAALLLLSQRLHEELSGRLDRHPFLKICFERLGASPALHPRLRSPQSENGVSSTSMKAFSTGVTRKCCSSSRRKSAANSIAISWRLISVPM